MITAVLSLIKINKSFISPEGVFLRINIIIQDFFPLCDLENENKHFFLKSWYYNYWKQIFSRMILRNKDVQYWDRSVLFSTLSFYESWGMVFRELNNSLSPQIFQVHLKNVFHSSLYHHHIINLQISIKSVMGHEPAAMTLLNNH